MGIERNSIKSKIIGKWGGLGEGNPVWKIDNDSIHYYNTSKSYPYKLVDSNFTIDFSSDFPGHKVSMKIISIVNDTMTFRDDQPMIITAYRF